MPYENLMPYVPMREAPSLVSLRQRAQLNRDQYEQDEINNINYSVADPGKRLQAEMAAISRHNQGRTFASSNPSWDAWFQSLNEGTGGRQGSGIIGGGRSAQRQGRALRADALGGEQDAEQFSPYNVEGRARVRGARPSLKALDGISYLQG